MNSAEGPYWLGWLDKLRDVMGQHEGRPRGWYLAAEAGWLAGVSGDRVGQWARRGYIRASVDSGNPHVYSFQDVAEAMVVHHLLDRGVKHVEIRKGIERCRERYGDWPLTEAPLFTTDLTGGRGHEALVLEEDEVVFDIGVGSGGQVLAIGRQDLKRVAEQLRRGGWVVRNMPDIHHIEVDPDRLSGFPTIRNRRVPADMVAQVGQTAEGMRTLRREYDLTTPEIRDAIRWYSAVTEFARAA